MDHQHPANILLVRNQFIQLSTKFLFINVNHGVNDNTNDLNSLLNELSSLELAKYGESIDSNSALRLLESLSNIPATEETLIVKSGYLINALVKLPQIDVPIHIVSALVEWLIKSINYNYNSIACDVFQTLRILIKGNTEKLSRFYDDLLSPEGIFFQALSSPPSTRVKKDAYETDSSEDIKLSAILCCESFFSYSDENIEIDLPSEYIRWIGIATLHLIYTARPEKYGESNYATLIAACLNVCRIVCWLEKTWASEKVGEIIGGAKAFVMYKIADVQQIQPKKIVVSQQTIFEPKVEKVIPGNKVLKVKKPRHFDKSKRDDYKNKLKQNLENTTILENISTSSIPKISYFFRTSDSDVSESESSRAKHDRRKEARVRQTALYLIGTLGKISEKRIFFGYWHSLFPTENNTHNSISLLNCILRDPSPNCRINALQTVAVILYGSKPYLTQADMSESGSANFTPYSVVLGTMVSSIYTILTQALANEASPIVLIQIIKCLNVLFQSTPISRLPHGIVSKIVQYIRRLIYCKDVNIQVCALTVMEVLLSSSEVNSEIYEVIGVTNVPPIILKTPVSSNNAGVNDVSDIEYDDDEVVIDSDYEENDEQQITTDNSPDNQCDTKMSWLLQRILGNLGVDVTDKRMNVVSLPSIRIGSLQVLSGMATHFYLLEKNLLKISTGLKLSITDSNTEICHSAAKCLDALGHGISQHLANWNNTNQDAVAGAVNFWLDILPLIVEQIQDSNQSSVLRSVYCDALANIGVHVFERLSRDKHILLISVLSGCGCDNENVVQAAAVRALAVYVLFPSLKSNLCLIENTAETILRLMREPILQVRIKASWSLGNITDALLSSSETGEIELISNDVFERLLIMCTETADQTDRIRSNIMRSMGHLLRLIRKEHLEQKKWVDIFLAALNKLVTHGLNKGNVKVKWNTCYALGTIMKNSDIYNSKSTNQWQSIVYPALCSLIIECQNFKVRTNGSIALSIPSTRQQYGTYFIKCWTSLLKALEKTEDIINFHEYKHRDDLMDQLCTSISHFINLIEKDDLIACTNELFPKVDTVHQYWVRVINRVLPEKAAPLLSAHLKLKNFNTSVLNSEQKNAVKVLCGCFVSVTEYT